MPGNLQKYRKTIDFLDGKLIDILSRRFKIAQKIGGYKAKNNLPIQDKKREKDSLKDRRLLARNRGLDPNLISQIFMIIFKFTKRNHKKIRRKIKNEQI